jgi:1-acyl-sn-glycerol-3-phosphate acyltransferase
MPGALIEQPPPTQQVRPVANAAQGRVRAAAPRAVRAGTKRETPFHVHIDGFQERHKEAFEAFSPGAADRFYAWLDRLARRLQVDVAGLENLPAGRAILVANHAFGWDIAFPMGAIWRSTHRPVWALGEHAWWRFPFLRRAAAALGTVDGSAKNCSRLLEAEQLVLVLPGGLREAVKPRELRYRLMWGARYGFVRAAIRHRAPLVPLASIGADELFDFVGDAYERGRRWTHHEVPIPVPKRILPIPHRVHLRYVIGEPVCPGAPPDAADDPDALRRARREIEGALHELIDQELARRSTRPS